MKKKGAISNIICNFKKKTNIQQKLFLSFMLLIIFFIFNYWITCLLQKYI